MCVSPCSTFDNKIWYNRYVTGGDPNLILFNFLKSVISVAATVSYEMGVTVAPFRT
jgi:hypothetical protein